MAGNNPTSINRALPLVPSDATAQSPLLRGIYVGGAGNIVAQFSSDPGVDVTFVAPAVGQILWIDPNLVKATGTTATGLLAIF